MAEVGARAGRIVDWKRSGASACERAMVTGFCKKEGTMEAGSYRLVMIHGLLGSIAYFGPKQRLPDVAVHTPDLLGYGASRRAAGDPIALRTQAEWVAEYMRARIGRPCWVLGHS